jgi:hypothetical protein
MYRYDYVLRLIERLGQILRTLRDRLLRREMTHEDLHAEIQEIAREAGLDLAFARRLDPGMLAAWLAPDPDRVDQDRVWLMAELLFVEAMAARSAGDEQQAGDDLRRALALFARIAPEWKPGDDLVTAADRIAELTQLLDDGAHGDTDTDSAGAG